MGFESVPPQHGSAVLGPARLPSEGNAQPVPTAGIARPSARALACFEAVSGKCGRLLDVMTDAALPAFVGANHRK